MKTRVVVKRYAEVDIDGLEFIVYENGNVERWDGGHMGWLDASDDYYEDVREAGLAALKETQ